MSIGKNIAKYRKALKMTQEQLGERLGVTNQAVSKWESEVSMPDIMLLPQIATALGITLDDIYGIAKKLEKTPITADDFPSFCYKKLHEAFYYNTRFRFTHIDNSDVTQIAYQTQKFKEGCRIGDFSNTQGAVVMTEDFAFIDCNYKASGSEDYIIEQCDDDYTLMYLTDKNLRKVLFYQYKTAFSKSKESNTEFMLEEIMEGCNLTKSEATNSLKLLVDININEMYTDRKTKTRKYFFRISNAVYALAIYKLAGLLSEEDPIWTVVRDTSMISDYAFN